MPEADFHCAVRSRTERLAVPGSSGNTFSSDVSSLSDIASALQAAIVLEPVGLLGRSRCVGLLRLDRRRFVPRLGALQQRIALDLLVDELLELEMGELQQPDRLHQLRRHHQRLRLAQL